MNKESLTEKLLDLSLIHIYGGEIGAFTVQILHQRRSQFGGFQRVLVEVLSLPVGEAFLDHLCHGLVDVSYTHLAMLLCCMK